MERRSDTLDAINAEIAKQPDDPDFRLRAVDIRQGPRSTIEIDAGSPLDVRIEYDVFREAYGLHVYFQINDMDGTVIFETCTTATAMSTCRWCGRATTYRRRPSRATSWPAGCTSCRFTPPFIASGRC